jgi:hypothetical protein
MNNSLSCPLIQDNRGIDNDTLTIIKTKSDAKKLTNWYIFIRLGYVNITIPKNI